MSLTSDKLLAFFVVVTVLVAGHLTACRYGPPPITLDYTCSYIEPDAADAETLAFYEATPEEVIDRATGRWFGTYPGGEATPPFDFVIDVTVHSDAEIYFWVAEPMRKEVTEAEHMACAKITVSASIVVDAGPTWLEWPPGRAIGLKGNKITDSVPQGRVEDMPSGVVGYTITISPPYPDTGEPRPRHPGFEVFLDMVFLGDGTTWISAEEEGCLFKQSGVRVP